jgi:hypothetical protein
MKKNLIILSMLVLGVFMFSTVSAGLFDFTGNAIAKFDDSADIELKEGALIQIELDGEEVELLAVVIDGDSATINVDGNIIEMSKRTSKRVGKYTVKLVSTDSSFWRRDKSRIEIKNFQEFPEDGESEDEDLTVYPVPFISEGLADVAIIYGTEPNISILELVEAGNIQSDLFGYLEIIDGAPGNIIYGSDELSGNVDINFIDTNFIVIGSYCSNEAIWGLLGEDSCEDVWDRDIEIESGEFLIESFSNPFNEEKIMLYVVGYDVAGVVAASQYLRSHNVDTSVGARYVSPVMPSDEEDDSEVTYESLTNILSSGIVLFGTETWDTCSNICHDYGSSSQCLFALAHRSNPVNETNLASCGFPIESNSNVDRLECMCLSIPN